jgi:hypothetical protein
MISSFFINAKQSHGKKEGGTSIGPGREKEPDQREKGEIGSQKRGSFLHGETIAGGWILSIFFHRLDKKR